MRYRILGKTGLQVSEIGFGCWPIGGSSYGPVRDEESLEALEAAFEHGVNFYDTADVYGQGHSETLLGQFMKNKARERIIVATKTGLDFTHGGIRKNFDAAYLRSSCNDSLKRLGIEAIDVYQLHNPTLKSIASGEVFRMMERLKQDGKIRFIGVSVFTEEEAFVCLREPCIDVIQVRFNLLDQRMADRVFPAAHEKNVGIIAREPLASGMLTGKYQTTQNFPKNDHRSGWAREKIRLMVQKIDKMKTVFATNRLSLTRAALEYLLNFEEVGTVICGAKSRQQVLENILASEEPCLRSQEASQLHSIYHREAIFKEGLE